MSSIIDKLLFLHELVWHPRQIASPAPSAPSTVRTIAECIASDTRKVVVEYGPGEGSITRGLLQEGILTPDSKIILIEANRRLANRLQKTIRDSRVSIFHDTARNVRDIVRQCGEEFSDIAISGVPHSLMSDDEVETITQETADSLRKPNGEYLVYNRSNKVYPFLKTHFTHVETSLLENNGKPKLTLFKADFREDTDPVY